jgi:hypothetical protein
MKNLVPFIVGLTLLQGFCFNGSERPQAPLKLTIDNLCKNNIFNRKLKI